MKKKLCSKKKAIIVFEIAILLFFFTMIIIGIFISKPTDEYIVQRKSGYDAKVSFTTDVKLNLAHYETQNVEIKYHIYSNIIYDIESGKVNDEYDSLMKYSDFNQNMRFSVIRAVLGDSDARLDDISTYNEINQTVLYSYENKLGFFLSENFTDGQINDTLDINCMVHKYNQIERVSYWIKLEPVEDTYIKLIDTYTIENSDKYNPMGDADLNYGDPVYLDYYLGEPIKCFQNLNTFRLFKVGNLIKFIVKKEKEDIVY